MKNTALVILIRQNFQRITSAIFVIANIANAISESLNIRKEILINNEKEVNDNMAEEEQRKEELCYLLMQ